MSERDATESGVADTGVTDSAVTQAQSADSEGPAAAESSDESAAESADESSAGAAVAHASGHEDPTAAAEGLGAGLGDRATGDIVIDSALQDLEAAPPDDLDAQIEAGQRVQATLQARLSDLGGE